jgi:hypothetical protein
MFSSDAVARKIRTEIKIKTAVACLGRSGFFACLDELSKLLAVKIDSATLVAT